MPTVSSGLDSVFGGTKRRDGKSAVSLRAASFQGVIGGSSFLGLAASQYRGKRPLAWAVPWLRFQAPSRLHSAGEDCTRNRTDASRFKPLPQAIIRRRRSAFSNVSAIIDSCDRTLRAQLHAQFGSPVDIEGRNPSIRSTRQITIGSIPPTMTITPLRLGWRSGLPSTIRLSSGMVATPSSRKG